MLKKLLFSSFVAASFAANAQVLVQENFQGFSEQGYVAGENAACGAKPIEGTFTLDKTYGTNTITYTFVNAAVSPTCAVKKANPTAVKQCIDLIGSTGIGSDGYFELGKSSEYLTTNAAGTPGSVSISELPFVGTVKFNASWTGNGRKGEFYTSIDKGVNWVLNTEVIEDASENVAASFDGGVCGASFTVNVNTANVMIKFAALDQRTRIHDLVIDGPTGIDNTSLFDNGASVTVVDNVMTVSSPKNGSVQVVNLSGATVAQANVNGEASFNIAQSGMYVVRLTSDNKVSTKKVIVL